MTHTMSQPEVEQTGGCVSTCSCGLTLRGSTTGDVKQLMAEHDPSGSQRLCIGCSQLTSLTKWPLCERCRQRGSTAISVVVVLLACATVGVALRYGGWARLGVGLVAVVLCAIGLRLDARPRVRR